MSYRKKHYPPKPPKKGMNGQQEIGSIEYSNPGVERSIPTEKLFSGQAYQRPVDEKAVDNLIKHWDDRLLDPLVVSFRDGRFYVVDGQHRISAMKRMNGSANVMVPCKVYSGLTYEQEAELYYKLDLAKTHLTMAQSTKALLESGVNKDYTEIRRLIEAAGFRWMLEKKAGAAKNEILATRAIFSSYKTLGADAFSRMLALLKRTWDGVPDSLSAMMISGMTLFLKTYDKELDDKTFTQRLAAVAPLEIIRRAKADFSTSRNDLRCGRVLLEKYNGGQRGGRKLKYSFPN